MVIKNVMKSCSFLKYDVNFQHFSDDNNNNELTRGEKSETTVALNFSKLKKKKNVRTSSNT